jgi:hypothetical protein
VRAPFSFPAHCTLTLHLDLISVRTDSPAHSVCASLVNSQLIDEIDPEAIVYLAARTRTANWVNPLWQASHGTLRAPTPHQRHRRWYELSRH